MKAKSVFCMLSIALIYGIVLCAAIVELSKHSSAQIVELSEDKRPTLRWILTPNPYSLKRQLTDEILTDAKEYLETQEMLPWQVQHAIEAHEIWLGMTAKEVRLAIGEPTEKQKINEEQGTFSWLYAHEGWVLRFDARGFLLDFVEH